MQLAILSGLMTDPSPEYGNFPPNLENNLMKVTVELS